MSGQAHRDSAGASVQSPSGPLQGIRVIDVSTLFAGPMTATLLADYGADVIKVEHPGGDGLRGMGWQIDGTSLVWTVTNRNKRCVTLDLHTDDGQRLFRRLTTTADVVIENFRPGALERWSLGFENLRADNPGLIMLQVTAFGQTGPWRARPGFGTIAEAISGFAFINGHPEGPPTLPPFALGDAVAGVFGATAVLAALHHRDATPNGRGQAIDLSIYEPLFSLLGPQMAIFDRMGEVQSRSGNHTPFSAPRNIYRTSDDRWLAISASAQSIAERLMRMVEQPEYVDEPWFANVDGRLHHQAELDEVIRSWIVTRTSAEVMAQAEQYQVAIGPVYSIEDIAHNEQYLARKSFVRVADGLEDGGSIAIQNVVPMFAETPAKHRWLGRLLGADDDAILCGELGLGADEMARLRATGVVAPRESHGNH